MKSKKMEGNLEKISENLKNVGEQLRSKFYKL